MKVNANWCAKMVAFAMVFALMFMALSCGGGGTNNLGLEAAPTYTSGGTSDADIARGTGVIVTEENIATLPRWQQELLSDPGWNQPYIDPPAETSIEGPSFELLMELTRQRLESGMSISPRGITQGKAASWDNLGPVIPILVRGEYDEGPAGMTPDFGCNSNGINAGSDNHAIEDLIAVVPMTINPVSFVQEGMTAANYFNKTGGLGNDMLSAVYQLFAEDRTSDMNDPDFEWAEVSYNSGLMDPPAGPGDSCAAATAIEVEGSIWRCFNREIDAQPGLNSTKVYNMLVAPSAPVTSGLMSSGDSTFDHQPFYFGTVGSCFGGAWIVSITGSSSSCDNFEDFFLDDQKAAQEFFTNPIYGVLLKRWRESSPSGTPWEAQLGLPVFGPFAYSSGSPILTGKGQYYAWGMWFEKGFMWWIDYDNEGPLSPYPNATDEAQTYVYDGDNVYCPTDDPTTAYIKQPTVFYGGQGDLGVAVAVQAQRELGTDPWAPVVFLGDHYEVPLNDDLGLATVTLSMFAQGFGGMTDADCNYKHYIWALRNGSIVIPAGGDFDPGKRFLNGTYGSAVENQESIYVVRVQVTDANDDIAYGDSFPIHLGHGASGATGSFETVTIVNNDDAGDYPLALTAIEDDLDSLINDYSKDFAWAEVGYSGSVADDIIDNDVKLVIWYRGGPSAASGEPNNEIEYTDEELDQLDQLRQNGVPVLHFTQSLTPYGPSNFAAGPHILGGAFILQFGSYFEKTTSPGWSSDVDVCRNLFGFYEMNFNYVGYSCTGPVHGTNVAGGNYNYYGIWDRTMGECYLGAGSSGNSWVNYGWSRANQTQGQTNRNTNFDGIIPIGYSGCARGVGDWSYTFMSSGNTINKQYWIGYNWADLVITSGSPATPTRAQVLQNVMASLDSNIWDYGSGGGGGGEGSAFSPYVGDDPKIVLVKPVFWNDDGTYVEGAAGNEFTYPDPTGTDVLRSTATIPGPGYHNDDVMRTSTQVATPGTEDGLNGNDIDLQAPFYGYWHYGPDGTTEDISGNPADSVDDIFWAGGFVCHNPDWDGDTLPDYALNLGDPGIYGTPPGSRQVTGYYTNYSGSDPMTDGHISANYGTNVQSVAFDGRNGVMSYEAIARWAPTGSLPNGIEAHGTAPARLRWCLYPGHGVVRPDTFEEYGKDVSWKNYLGEHPIANTDVGTRRDMAGFLRPAFTLGGNEVLTDGRIIEFDYRNVIGWKTDFNGNFVHADLPVLGVDPGDKFPARARLITGWSGYYANNSETAFPNTLPDPTTFMEVGVYVVDTSEGDPGVIIQDDSEMPDPGYEDTLDNASSPDYTIDLYFEIVGGTPNYDVYLDPAYDIDTYDPFNPYATFGDEIGETFVGTYNSAGAKSAMDVAWTDTDGGPRFFALRVEDAGLNAGFFFYPDTVNVGPPMSVAILNDPNSANAAAYNNLVSDISDLYGSAVITTFDLSTDLSPNDLDGFNGVLWASDYAYTPGFRFYNVSQPCGWSYGSGMANLTEVARFVNDGGTLFLCGPTASMIRYYNSTNDLGNIIPMIYRNYSSSYTGYNAQWGFQSGVQSYPNTLYGLDTYDSPIGPTYCSCYHYTFSTSYWRSGSVRTINGYSPTSSSYATGAYLLNVGSGNIVQLHTNWGDFADVQGDGATRAECLQNQLCMAGDNPDPWDPDYVPPPPTTVLYQDDLDGGVTGSANFYAAHLGGTYTNPFTVLDGPANTFGTGEPNVDGNAYCWDPTALGQPSWGTYNNKVLYWGPLDFSAETMDPIVWMRVFQDMYSSGTSYDRVYWGWDQDTNDPPTMTGTSSYSTPPPAWDYTLLEGDMGARATPVLFDLSLVGAAGQDNVWLTVCYSSYVLNWSNSNSFKGIWIDNFTAGTYGLPPSDI